MSGSDSSDSGMTPRARATLATITQENRRHQIDWLESAVRSVEARLSVEEDRGAERNWNKEFQDILGNVLGNSLATSSVVVLTPFFIDSFSISETEKDLNAGHAALLRRCLFLISPLLFFLA